MEPERRPPRSGTHPAPGPGRGHLSPAGKAKRERNARRVRQFCLDAMHDPDMGGWGGPAKGAHPSKPRTLPQAPAAVNLDDLDDLAEREAELRARSEVWCAKLRTFTIRRANRCAYRTAVIAAVIARAVRCR